VIVLVDQWCDWYRAGDASPGTIKVRRGYLTRLAAVTPLEDITEADLIAWLQSAGFAPNSRKSALASVRSFYRWAVDRGLLEHDPTAGLRPVKVPDGVPKPIAQRDLDRAVAAADGPTTLMLMLGSLAGLRRSEIAAVHSDHVTDLGLMVTGKGGKTRRVPIHPRLHPLLDHLEGFAFPSPRRPGQPVTGDFIEDRLMRVLPPPWTAHSLRHYFATHAYAGTRDIRAVQQLLGHSSVATTQRYVALDQEALLAAVLAVA
jgi:site-specific recombinase XerC